MPSPERAPENSEIESELDDSLKQLLGVKIKASYDSYLKDTGDINQISITNFFHGIIILYTELPEKEKKKWKIVEYLKNPERLKILEKVRGTGNKGKFTVNLEKVQEYFKNLVSLGILNQTDDCISEVTAKVEAILRKSPTSK